MEQPLRFEKWVTIAAPPESVWPLVADTERMNRAVGLPPVRYRAEARPEGGSKSIAEYRLGWLPLARWAEEPFQWEEPRSYFVERHYHWGPLETFLGGVELAPTQDGGTQVRIWADLTPRHLAGRLLAKLVVGPMGVRRGARQCEVFGRYLTGEIGDPFPQLRKRHGHVASAPTERGLAEGTSVVSSSAARGAWQRLAETSGHAAWVERLRQHVTEAADVDVVNMRPFELADRWQVDRLGVLALCLHATNAGVLTMRWDVLCPHCRTAKGSYGTLVDLQPQVFCESCNVTYDAHFDENVEVRFSVARSVRHAQTIVFCANGPRRASHRIAQLTIPGGGASTLRSALDTGRYALSSRQSAGKVEIEASGESPSTLGARLVTVYADRMGPDRLSVQPGRVALTVANHLATTTTLSLEKPEWPDTAATAALVSTLPEFHDLYSSQVLAPGIQVAVERLVVLFTDLAGSTRMYRDLGQARAFRVVQDHFRILRTVIRAYRGTEVKTMGDALMAVFPSAPAAFDAAVAMQRAMAALDTGGTLDPPAPAEAWAAPGPVRGGHGQRATGLLWHHAERRGGSGEEWGRRRDRAQPGDVGGPSPSRAAGL